MKRKIPAIPALFVCTALSLGIGIAVAQDSKSASPPDQLRAFVGDGTCSGNVMAMDKQPGHATVGKYRGEEILDGHWVVIHYDEDRTAANPKPYHVVQYIGYDTGKKRFIAVTFDNSGAPYSMGTSQGWQGNTITFDERAEGVRDLFFRDTFTNGDSGLASHTGTMKDKHGKWVKTDEETCHKA